MVYRDQLTEYIESIFGVGILEKAKKKDEFANGIQISGKEKVEKVALGVSLNLDFLEKAINWGADYCIFHHGFDVRTFQSIYSLSSQKRLKLIFENNLTIAGYHYALDTHPEIGNNAIILNKLGANIDEAFYDDWGYIGIYTESKSVRGLKERCEKMFDHEVYAVYSGNKKVRKFGVCSGGAKPHSENIAEMHNKGVELFISGETSESLPHQMKENEINYFLCGHYATETFGIKKLQEYISKEFEDKLEAKFLDSKNPI